MEIRPAITKEDVPSRSPQFLRERLVINGLFKVNELTFVQSHHDRILIGGATLKQGRLDLKAPEDFGGDQLLERRELGLACLSGRVNVEVDGEKFDLESEDIIYIGRGASKINVSGDGDIYISSSMCHERFPTKLVKRGDAETLVIGDKKKASERTLRKYIHDQGVQSAAMAMGITTIHEGSVWNTMPCHVHERRTEVYLYFDIDQDEKVVHLFGEPNQTRSLVLGNKEAIISPAWSVHTGAGTTNYKFVWSTAGENVTYTDFKPVATSSLA